MKSKYAFILAFLITGLIASNVFILKEINRSPPETTVIQRVIDGDTFETSDKKVVRLLNINTPEKNEPFYKEAKQFLIQYENKTIFLEITGTDKYQRELGRVYSMDNIYLNLEIIKEGLATPFLVEDAEAKIFSQALQQAIGSQKGIWKHSSNYNCVKTDILPKEEKVFLNIICLNLTIQNWLIRDESRKNYLFKTATNKNTLILNSGIGNDNETDIYWNLKTDVWNNDRDTLYLFDSNALLVNFNSYGY